MKQGAITAESMVHLSVPAEARSRATRYSRVAILLHWLVAVLVLSTIPIGWYGASSPAPTAPPAAQAAPPVAQPAPPAAQSIPPAAQSAPRAGTAPRPAFPRKSAAQQSATNAHKTIGIVILFLTVLRIGWRLTHKPPALPEHMARPLRWLARASHAIFYFLLVAMPLSGWWMSSALPGAMRHAFGFGFFDIPFLPVPQGWASAGPAKFIHVNLALLMIGLALLHIFAALKHHFVDRDDVLKRMLPRRL